MTDAAPWFPIRTERLLLREFCETDFDAAHVYASDPEVVRYMDWGPNTLDDTRAFLDRMSAAQARWLRPDVNLAAEHLADGRVIGAIRLGVTDAVNRTVQDSPRRPEGLLRQNQRLRGEWRDTLLYAILAEEWISPG